MDSTASSNAVASVTVDNNTMSGADNATQNYFSFELHDTRIYRALSIAGKGEDSSDDTKIYAGIIVKPFVSRQTYIGDFIEAPGAVLQNVSNLSDMMLSNNINSADMGGVAANEALVKESLKKLSKDALETLEEIENLTSNAELAQSYTSSFSMMHPYALLRLSGARLVKRSYESEGSPFSMHDGDSNIIDSAKYQRWYEIDDNKSTDPNIDTNSATASVNYNSNHYSKTPTTGDIINWGGQDPRGRFPYAFQDFVFCKHWNKIENNRMITLRRYPGPVLDNVEPANYESYADLWNNALDQSALEEEQKAIAKHDGESVRRRGSLKKNEPFSPLATAVTYFGEGTGNNLADILSFSVGYEWEEMNSNIHQTSSQQIQEGQVFNNTGAGKFLSTGLGTISMMLGLFGDFTGDSKIIPSHAAGLPPDPYIDGPYVNRVLGPVNSINNVYKRKRGLKYTSNGLTLVFDYVSRPISNVNNKAILLDILANIMALSYASGVWFGGLHKYRCEHPAIYPWRNASSLNKIYAGKLFGKDGAFSEIFRTVYNDKTKGFVANFAKDLIDGIKAVAHDLVNAITGNSSSSEQSEADASAKRRGAALFNQGLDTAGRAFAAHCLKGTQAPWITGAKALLTGDPIGDWHLTIGNPFNPIAMIGNLILEDCKIEFSEELGPDDFPIGFKATITLKHGMGRDKDSVESMFNRGNGRLYILSDSFKSSADFETRVDNYTGDVAERKQVQNTGSLATSGSFSVTAYKTAKLKNSLDNNPIFGTFNPKEISAVKESNGQDPVKVINIYRTTAWAMHQIL